VKEKILLLFTIRKNSLEKLNIPLGIFSLETLVNQNAKPTRKALRFVKAKANLSHQLEILKAQKQTYVEVMLATSTVLYTTFVTLGFVEALFGNITS